MIILGPIAVVTDPAYGADPTGRLDSSDAFEAALLALAALPYPFRCLFIPAGTYRLSRPWIVWLDGVDIRGAGRATRLVADPWAPAIVVDARADVPGGVRPDGFGVLDATLAPSSGVVRGFATRAPGDPAPRYWMIAAGCAPSVFGTTSWDRLSTLTLDVCFGRLPTEDVGLLGLGSGDFPSPFYLSTWTDDTGKRQFLVAFRTAQARYLRPGDPPRQWMFGDLAHVDLAKPVRIGLTMDMTRPAADGTCALAAWINGRSVAVRPWYGTRLAAATASEPSFTPADRLTFARNRMAHFKVGNPSWEDHSTGLAPADRPDLSVFGLALGTDAPYATDPAGNQVRADGGPLGDAFRYRFGQGRDGKGLLSLFNTDAALVAPSGSMTQFFYMYGQPNADVLGQVRWEQGDPGMARAPHNVSIRDLSVSCGAYAPAALLLGPTGENTFTLDGVTLAGGRYGLLSTNDAAKYDIFLRRCSLSGEEAWLQAATAMIWIDGLDRQYVVGGGLRFSACYVRCGRVLTAETKPGAFTLEIVADAGDYAHGYAFGEIMVNNEGAPQTPIYVERGATTPMTVVLSNLSPGNGDAAHPPIVLVDPFPGQAGPKPRLIVHNAPWGDVLFSTPAAPYGPNEWQVLVDGRWARGGPPAPATTTPTGTITLTLPAQTVTAKIT